MTGLPRSGTSLMMQICQAAGLELCTDGKRKPDEYNKWGYFEVDGIIGKLKRDPFYLDSLDGNVVKVVAAGIKYIKSDIKVIFMLRPIPDIIQSMNKMLKERVTPDNVQEMLRLRNEVLIDCEARFSTLRINYKNLIEMANLPYIRLLYFLDKIPQVEELKAIVNNEK